MLFLSFFLGFVISYIGSITPSMLNLSAVKISIEKSKKQAISFSWGISFIVVFQAFFALIFLKTLLNSSFALEIIKKSSIVVFSLLSFYFYLQTKKKQVHIATGKIKSTLFIGGMFLSFINLFSIPFYAGVGAFLLSYNWMPLTKTTIFFFSFGSFFGTFVLLYHYILFADKLKTTIAKFSTYFNYVLCGITGAVATISLFKML